MPFAIGYACIKLKHVRVVVATSSLACGLPQPSVCHTKGTVSSLTLHATHPSIWPYATSTITHCSTWPTMASTTSLTSGDTHRCHHRSQSVRNFTQRSKKMKGKCWWMSMTNGAAKRVVGRRLKNNRLLFNQKGISWWGTRERCRGWAPKRTHLWRICSANVSVTLGSTTSSFMRPWWSCRHGFEDSSLTWSICKTLSTWIASLAWTCTMATWFGSWRHRLNFGQFELQPHVRLGDATAKRGVW